MSITTEKCREIVLRLTKAIETIKSYECHDNDDNDIKKNLSVTISPVEDTKKETKTVAASPNPPAFSSSAYSLLFQTLLELRTKSYTKNTVTRAKLIHYNIIKKLLHLLCEKPARLQAAYEAYLSKTAGRTNGDEPLPVGAEKISVETKHTEGETNKCYTKDEACSDGPVQPPENEGQSQQQQLFPFADFRDLLLSLLGNFCLDSAAQSQVIKHRGITVLRSILFECESISIWRRCCRTLANLAVDPVCRKAIQATDITAKIICILESSCDAECKATICRTLRLFADSDNLVKTILDCNGVTILIQICRYGTQTVKSAAVKTLAELGKKNCSYEFGQQILRGEGLPKLVEMTSGTGDYSENALCVLLYLSYHSFMRPLMGSANVIQTLQSKFESELPAYLYPAILNAFCLLSNESVNRVKLRQFGILKILLSALQDKNYSALHNRIISAFVNFLYDDSSFDLLLDNGLVPVLFVHLQRCAGFSVMIPDTEPFVESLLEAVMNRKNDGEGFSDPENEDRGSQKMNSSLPKMDTGDGASQKMDTGNKGSQKMSLDQLKIDTEGRSSHHMDTEDRGLDQIDTESRGSQNSSGHPKIDTEDMALHKMDIEDRGSHKMDIEDRGSHKMDIKDRGSHKMDIEDRGSHKMDIKDRGSHKMDIEDRGSHKMDIEDRESQKTSSGHPKIDTEDRCSYQMDIENRGSNPLEVDNPCPKRRFYSNKLSESCSIKTKPGSREYERTTDTDLAVERKDKSAKNQSGALNPPTQQLSGCSTASKINTTLTSTSLTKNQISSPKNSPQNPFPSNSNRLSSTRNQKRKQESQAAVPGSSKRYRLSLGIKTDLEKSPAILNVEVPPTHSLSPLGVETVANLVDMPAASVLSRVTQGENQGELCSVSASASAPSASIVAYHGCSLSEPSQGSSATNPENSNREIFVSLRTKCSVRQIEKILKTRGFFIKTKPSDVDRDKGEDEDISRLDEGSDWPDKYNTCLDDCCSNENASHQDCYNKDGHLDNELNHPGNELSHPGTKLSHPGDELSHLDNEISHPNNELNHQGNELSHPDNKLSHQGNKSSHPDNELNHPSNELSHQSNELSHPDNELSHQDNKLSHPDNELNHPSNEISHPGDELSHQDNELSHPDTELSHPDNELGAKQKMNSYCIDSPSYQSSVASSSDGSAVRPSSLFKAMGSSSGQCLSPLSNASYNSPDWSPTFSPQKKDFSSEDSYSSEEEEEEEGEKKLDRSPSDCHPKKSQIICPAFPESKPETSEHKKKTTGSTGSKKHSKSEDKVKMANRTTEDNILILLSRISQKDNPTKYLANVESFLCLLRYIGHVPLAFPRSVRILGRVVSNLFCLESLLGFMAPALIFLELMTSWNKRICDARQNSDMFWTPSRATWLSVGSAFSISSCIESSDDLLKAGQLILNEFGVVTEINFGTSLLAQHLMKKPTPQQNYVIACLPFLCRSHNIQKKLLVHMKGFEFLQDIIMLNPKSCLSKVVILGLSYLACHLKIKPDPITPTPYPKCSKAKKAIKCYLKGYPKDVTFVTEHGQKVFANKNQLARQSDVFSAMLSDNFLESKIEEIAIPNISLVALRFIVHYLHGCSARCTVIAYIVSPRSSLPFDGIVSVLAHADQYMLTELQNYLVKIVREKYLSYDTAGKFYNVASLHNYEQLQKECLTYCLVSLVFGSKSISCMMDILEGPYALHFLGMVKKTLFENTPSDPFAKV